jgi:hypothetical protein
MDNLIRFPCPKCGKVLKTPPEAAGKMVRCPKPECATRFLVPGAPAEPMNLPPEPVPGPFQPPQQEEPEDTDERPFPWGAVGGVGGLALVAALLYGGYWWIGRPTSDQVAAYEGYVRTGNELVELHAPVTTDAQAKQAEPKLVAKAEELLEFRKQMEAVGGRKKKRLDAEFESKLDNLNGKLAQLLVSNKPLVVVPAVTERKEYVIVRMGSFSNRGGTTPAPTPPGPGPRPEPPKPTPTLTPADLAGIWDAGDFAFYIEPDGKGRAVFGTNAGGTSTVLIGYYTIATKNGELNIAFELTADREKRPYEFTILPSSTASQLVVKEVADRVKPNPVTMKRRVETADPKTAPALTPAPPSAPPGTVAFGVPLITKTSFAPPRVEFQIQLDLAGGELLEAWASVGVPDAGKTLEIFAGALHQGLLSVNGVDFAKPDPSLKAQRVSMKKSATDAKVYDCTVRYPEVVLTDPETEFTIVAAVRKDNKIVKTNAATVRVNLKTGVVTPEKKVEPALPTTGVKPVPAGTKLMPGEVGRFETAGVAAVAFSSDGKRIVTVAGNLELYEWEVATGKQVRHLPGRDKHERLALSTDFRYALSAERPNPKTLGQLHVWDLESGKSLRSWPEPAGAWEVRAPEASFSADAASVAALYQEPYTRPLPGGGISIGGDIKEAGVPLGCQNREGGQPLSGAVGAAA